MEIESIGVIAVILLLLLYKPKRRVPNIGIRLQKLT
jgi:hypothetical protein